MYDEYTCSECGASITEDEYNNNGMCNDCAETCSNMLSALNDCIDYLLGD